MFYSRVPCGGKLGRRLKYDMNPCIGTGNGWTWTINTIYWRCSEGNSTQPKGLRLSLFRHLRTGLRMRKKLSHSKSSASSATPAHLFVYPMSRRPWLANLKRAGTTDRPALFGAHPLRTRAIWQRLRERLKPIGMPEPWRQPPHSPQPQDSSKGLATRRAPSGPSGG